MGATLPGTMAENIVVSVRVRPLNAKEEAKGTSWDVDEDKHAITPKVRSARRRVDRTSVSFSLHGGNNFRRPRPPCTHA